MWTLGPYTPFLSALLTLELCSFELGKKAENVFLLACSAELQTCGVFTCVREREGEGDGVLRPCVLPAYLGNSRVERVPSGLTR